MKRMKCILVIFLIITSRFCIAQAPMKALWSKWYDPESIVIPDQYLDKDNSGYYGLLKKEEPHNGMYKKQEPKTLAFFKIGINGEFVFTKKINIVYQEQSLAVTTSLVINNRFYLFATCPAKDKKSKKILVYEIDKKGSIDDTPKELLSLPVSDGAFSFKVYQPEKSDSFFVLTTISDGLLKGSFRLMQFNEEFKNLWTKDFKFPTGMSYNPTRVKVTNKKLYWLGYTDADSETKGDDYLLSCYDLIRTRATHLTIKMPDAIIRNVSLSLDDKGNPFVCGFYVKDLMKSEGMVDGFFVTKYSGLDGTEIFNSHRDFPVEFLKENTTEKRALAGKPILKSIYVQDFINRQDGSLVVVSQQGQQYPKLEYGSIVTISISRKGEIEWFKTIRNHQGSVLVDNLKYYSYVVGMSGDNLFFIYNENKDNENRPDPLTYVALNECHDANTTLAKIDRGVFQEKRFLQKTIQNIIPV
jgi:hypothetical protein